MSEIKYDARSVRPCKGGGILVESTFDRPFSMRTLCMILQGRGNCAEKLGVARFSYGDYAITLYKNGRVDVHSVESTERAIEIIDTVRAIVQEAFL